MASDLTDYCSYDEVRAILGVSNEELDDAVLGVPLYFYALKRELQSVAPPLPTLFDSVTQKQEDARTPEEANLYEATCIFSAYAVAKKVGMALGMFGVRSVTDSKAGFARFADSPYKDTLERLDGEKNQAKSALLAAIKALDPGASTQAGAPLAGLVVVKRFVDPVTGSSGV